MRHSWYRVRGAAGSPRPLPVLLRAALRLSPAVCAPSLSLSLFLLCAPDPPPPFSPLSLSLARALSLFLSLSLALSLSLSLSRSLALSHSRARARSLSVAKRTRPRTGGRGSVCCQHALSWGLLQHTLISSGPASYEHVVLLIDGMPSACTHMYISTCIRTCARVFLLVCKIRTCARVLYVLMCKPSVGTIRGKRRPKYV